MANAAWTTRGSIIGAGAVRLFDPKRGVESRERLVGHTVEKLLLTYDHTAASQGPGTRLSPPVANAASSLPRFFRRASLRFAHENCSFVPDTR